MNGGVFIKVGQYVGFLEYLFLKEYVEIMKVLYNKVLQFNVDELKGVFEEDLKMKVILYKDNI